MKVWSLLVLLTILLFSALPIWAQGTSLSLSPLPDSSVSRDDLTVSVSINGPLAEALNLSRARLFVAGKEVTAQCLRSDRFLTYRPIATPQAGVMEARLEFPNGVERSWSFQIAEPHVIESITHSSVGESLGEYEELTVTMKAAPGYKARFLVGEDDKKIHPMVEESPGLYVGTYTVVPGDFYLGEPVIGELNLGQRTEQKTADKPVTLFGHLFRVVIFSPQSGTSTPNNFDIKGRTRPGSKVTFVPKLSFQKNTRAPNTRSGSGASFETRADEQGYFTVNYGVPISLPNLSVVIAVTAAAPDGERSVPVILRYHF